MTYTDCPIVDAPSGTSRCQPVPTTTQNVSTPPTTAPTKTAGPAKNACPARSPERPLYSGEGAGLAAVPWSKNDNPFMLHLSVPLPANCSRQSLPCRSPTYISVTSPWIPYRALKLAKPGATVRAKPGSVGKDTLK